MREAPDPLVHVSMTVVNSGDRSSDVLVQLYCRDIVASVVTPDKKLIAFRKEFFQIGEKRLIEFELGFDAFALLDSDNNWQVEHGQFDMYAGLSSDEVHVKAKVLL